MDGWTYDELRGYIREDIEEFMGDGLNILQASSRVQVEYARSIEHSELEALIIYIVLCEEGVKHGFLSDDIREKTLDLLSRSSFDKQLDDRELCRLKEDMNRASKLLSKDQ